MERADNGQEIDRENGQLYVLTRNYQILFMHSMHEAIEYLGKVLYITEKDYIQLSNEVFKEK